MNYQLKSVGVVQTSAVAAILYFVLSWLIVIPLFLIGLVIPGHKDSFPMGGLFLVFLPFLYGILGFIFSAIACLIYNLVASFMGGIAFTLEEKK